jgi:hypothetical protein
LHLLRTLTSWYRRYFASRGAAPRAASVLRCVWRLQPCTAALSAPVPPRATPCAGRPRPSARSSAGRTPRHNRSSPAARRARQRSYAVWLAPRARRRLTAATPVRVMSLLCDRSSETLAWVFCAATRSIKLATARARRVRRANLERLGQRVDSLGADLVRREPQLAKAAAWEGGSNVRSRHGSQRGARAHEPHQALDSMAAARCSMPTSEMTLRARSTRPTELLKVQRRARAAQPALPMALSESSICAPARQPARLGARRAGRGTMGNLWSGPQSMRPWASASAPLSVRRLPAATSENAHRRTEHARTRPPHRTVPAA